MNTNTNKKIDDLHKLIMSFINDLKPLQNIGTAYKEEISSMSDNTQPTLDVKAPSMNTSNEPNRAQSP